MLGFLARAKNTITGTNVTENSIFPRTDPALDGEDCTRDCESCSVRYPPKWKINEDIPMYGYLKGWSRHLLVATGKDDWKREPGDESGSLCEALHAVSSQVNGGRLMVSGSNMALAEGAPSQETTGSVLLLPGFVQIEGVTTSNMSALVTDFINKSPTTSCPLSDSSLQKLWTQGQDSNGLSARPCTHRAIILLCSHKTRDARCGQSAPLLRKEFTRHLRHLGLARDADDQRPGGVGIYFISHTGGHKFSANVIIYRRRMAQDKEKPGDVLGDDEEGAFQGIWLARVRPEDCEGVIKYTVLKGKIVKPERQLRGGFDRERGLVSW